MERVWVDPRTVERRHAGIYKLRPGSGGLIVGREVGVTCVESETYGRVFGIFIPLRTAIVRETSLLNEPNYKPPPMEYGDPDSIIRYLMRLGVHEGINNRVYVGEKVSLARIEGEPDGLDVIVSTANKMQVVPYPPSVSLRSKIEELSGQRG